MNTLSAQPGLWSIRCYRWLLWLYPSSFVKELGDSVEQAFRDMLRDAYQKHGYLGIALLWFRIVPDFVFSAVELMTSAAGDYLKWYFRLRWVLACALGFGAGALAAMALRSAGFFDYLGINPNLGLAGLLVWIGLGVFQSQVLTSQFCHRARWVGLTILGGVLGMLGTRLITSALSFLAMEPFSPDKWLTWTLRPLVTLLPLVGAAIGFAQWFAFRQKDVRAFHWSLVCSFGAYLSGWLVLPFSAAMTFAIGNGFDEVMGTVLHNAIAGALFGLGTAGPLKGILWGQPSEPEPGAPLKSFPKEKSA